MVKSCASARRAKEENTSTQKRNALVLFRIAGDGNTRRCFPGTARFVPFPVCWYLHGLACWLRAIPSIRPAARNVRRESEEALGWQATGNPTGRRSPDRAPSRQG